MKSTKYKGKPICIKAQCKGGCKDGVTCKRKHVCHVCLKELGKCTKANHRLSKEDTNAACAKLSKSG